MCKNNEIRTIEDIHQEILNVVLKALMNNII